MLTDDNDIDISNIPDADREEDTTADDVDLESTDETDAQSDENLNEDDDTDTDPDEDAETEDDPAEDDEKDEKASHRNPKVERRIAKKVAQLKAAEETVKAQETELKTLRDMVAESKSGKTYASLTEVSAAKAKLRKELDEIEDAIDDGGFTNADGQTYDVKTLKTWRRQIRGEIEDALPAAERRLVRQEEINREQVSRLYPELLNPGSPQAKEADRLFARVPALKGDPEAFLMAGDLLRGRQMRMKLAAGKKAALKPPESREAAARSVSISRKRRNEDLDEISAVLRERD